MKWLFAAAAAVCLFACGGPQDDLTKEEGRPGVIVNATSGEYCSNGGSQPRAKLTTFTNPDDPKDFRNGTGIVGTFTHSVYGGCLGPTRSINCGCRLVGDKIFDLDSAGNQLYQKLIFTSCSGTPPPLVLGDVVAYKDGFQDANSDLWFPSMSTNSIGFCQ